MSTEAEQQTSVESLIELEIPMMHLVGLTPVKPSLFLFIAAELSEPFKNWIGGMWNLIADKIKDIGKFNT